tara:strand:+ start:5484 stop:6203 length:720 start_codon:yes stop_codon:yes gene_type:complete
MTFTKKMVEKTIWFSLIIQIITGIITFNGFFIKLNETDRILGDILRLETIVQFIEIIFYIWIANSVLNVKNMASKRYFDWSITTPLMLLTTIMYMKYKENKENKDKNKNDNDLEQNSLTTKKFIIDNKENIFLIFGYNFLMLLFGYLGEIDVISKYITIPFGFIFFIKSFEIIYKNYANKSLQGERLFIFLTIVWSLYGIAATFSVNLKNICYNILDIISKNFYGLYIYYEIIKLTSVN